MLRRYEGLTRDDVPHMKGTIVMGNGTGGGFQNPTKGDVYEGEFEAGYAHGLGQYIGAKGEIYRGEFKKGQRNGYELAESRLIMPYHL
eukprot:scaffold248934_cov32-Prasinocladus_malaysianus.AAC.1